MRAGTSRSSAHALYDLAPVTDFALGRALRQRTSSALGSHGLTGGVYKARERIHRIGSRSFGSDPNLVAPMVAAAVEGMQSSGVSACLKHFPGLGDTVEDTHDGMATTEKSLEDFNAIDFPVYQAGINAGADMVMVSHLSAPNVTGDNTPASLSEKMITEILRGQLGYQGIVITDAMGMTAITDYYTADEAAVKAVQAGADMILMPEDYETAYNGVLEAVNNGTLSEERINESLRRIFRVKEKNAVE